MSDYRRRYEEDEEDRERHLRLQAARRAQASFPPTGDQGMPNQARREDTSSVSSSNATHRQDQYLPSHMRSESRYDQDSPLAHRGGYPGRAEPGNTDLLTQRFREVEITPSSAASQRFQGGDRTPTAAPQPPISTPTYPQMGYNNDRTPAGDRLLSALRGPPPPETALTQRSYAPSISSRLREDMTSSTRPVSAASSARSNRLADVNFNVRPGYGKEGRPVTVRSNYFMVRALQNKGKIINHYDVEIDPVVRVANQKKPKDLLRAVWFQLAFERESMENDDWAPGFAASAYDGRKNAFTPVPFPIPFGETKTFTTTVGSDRVVIKRPDASSSDDDSARWKVSIKLVAKVDLEEVMKFCRADQRALEREELCLTGLMATNVLLRDLPSKQYTQVGASGNRFFTMDGAVSISQGAQVCRGFMQSFRHSESGQPLLNLDIGFSAFLSPGPVIDVISKILNRGIGGGGRGGRGRGGGNYGGPGREFQDAMDLREMTKEQIGLVKNKLRGAKFLVTHRQSTRLHTIMSISLLPACDIFFLMEDKNGQHKRITVTEYYKQYYGATVTRPNLPCAMYGKKNFIPLEFVKLADFNLLPPTKLSPDQTAEIIKIAAMKPRDRHDAVGNWRQELEYEKQEKLHAWGLSVDPNMVEVNARILPTPKVLYAGNRDANAIEGAWNLRNNRFFRPGPKPLIAWSIISFDKFFKEQEQQRYAIYLIETLQKLGVPVQNRTPECHYPVNPLEPGAIKSALQMAARSAYVAGKCAPQLIMVVLPGRDSWLYEEIKKTSFMDLKAPVPTQCMQAGKIRMDRGIQAYTENLAMKVQSKLGGLTHQVPISELPGMVRGKTMLLGADLGHPPMKSADMPSVACSIATFTADCDAYSAQVRLQEGRAEIINDYQAMVVEHLKIFFKRNGEFPSRILIFRDGLSEGQYANALTHEQNAVIQACATLQVGYRPKILICVCAKRHNTRFFGQDRDVDKSGNMPGGLVVDRMVTHPYAFDFFLQAHQGRVGTARPTHYICLLDELGISPDDLQKMVNALCYAFARCTRSVSLVPVCYIADLVCQKARIIVQENGGYNTPSETSGGRSGASGGERRNRKDLDVMQVQTILRRNPELEDVAWWM